MKQCSEPCPVVSATLEPMKSDIAEIKGHVAHIPAILARQKLVLWFLGVVITASVTTGAKLVADAMSAHRAHAAQPATIVFRSPPADFSSLSQIP